MRNAAIAASTPVSNEAALTAKAENDGLQSQLAKGQKVEPGHKDRPIDTTDTQFDLILERIIGACALSKRQLFLHERERRWSTARTPYHRR